MVVTTEASSNNRGARVTLHNVLQWTSIITKYETVNVLGVPKVNQDTLLYNLD